MHKKFLFITIGLCAFLEVQAGSGELFDQQQVEMREYMFQEAREARKEMLINNVLKGIRTVESLNPCDPIENRVQAIFALLPLTPEELSRFQSKK